MTMCPLVAGSRNKILAAGVISELRMVTQEATQNNVKIYLHLIKEARIYNGEKTASSVSGAGKTGQVHVKE